MPVVRIALATAAAIGWGVLLAKGLDIVRADRIYAAAYRDGLEAAKAA